MIENLSDFLSVAVTAAFSLAGFYLLYQANISHYEKNMRYLEERYYRYYDESDNEYDDIIWDEPFYEEYAAHDTDGNNTQSSDSQ